MDVDVDLDVGVYVDVVYGLRYIWMLMWIVDCVVYGSVTIQS